MAASSGELGKRKMSGRMSKKMAWRKLASSQTTNVLPEIHDTIAKRLVQSTVANKNSKTIKKQSEPFTNTVPFFRFDAVGASSLGRITQKHLHQLSNKTLNLSQYHVAAVSKVKRSASRREKIQNLDAVKRKKLEDNYDIWTSTPVNQHVENMKSKKDLVSNTIPAVCVPLPGLSINPDPIDYRNSLLAVAAAVLEKDRKEQEAEENMYPITTELMTLLPVDLLNGLDFLQKQKIFHFLSKLSDVDPERETKVLNFISNELPKQEEQTTNQLDSNSDNGEADEGNSILAKMSKRAKSEVTRRRFRRHCREVREAKERRKQREYLNSINFTTQYIAEMEERKKQLSNRKTYNQRVQEAHDKDKQSNKTVYYKSGRYIYKDEPDDVILPSTSNETIHSLQKLRLRDIPAAALKDRMASIYRRKLTEPIHKHAATLGMRNAPRHFGSLKRRRRKIIVKIK
ncbi:uncharacterized protein LOC128882895 [Hylaeus volcanicus]|uniref:uncharacterized protein LOC128882895 n=1 Tax=Hylaeus volcanicus TaxID=313075 RepID=UPI0023B86FC3|nr:uncharacterized protein LOC128882895 [Hylaeus volcanicus]